jgi:TatD DNase family protein
MAKFIDATLRSKFIDIGANLLDPMFRGLYRGVSSHADDFHLVLERAWAAGVERIIVTAGTLSEARAALELCATDPRLFTTVGVHPTRCLELENGGDGYMKELLDLALSNREKVVAIGECGLDWDRVHFCPKDVQLRWFEAQFELAEKTGLPMFLHMRGCPDEFLDVMRRHRHRVAGGVVHSFTDSLAAAEQIIGLDLFVGLNGCSLRTDESLAVAAMLPLERLMLETDAPWCEVRPTHPGFRFISTVFPANKKERFVLGQGVRGRSEPAHIVHVCEVVAAARSIAPTELASRTLDNTLRLFFASGKHQ